MFRTTVVVHYRDKGNKLILLKLFYKNEFDSKCIKCYECHKHNLKMYYQNIN